MVPGMNDCRPRKEGGEVMIYRLSLLEKPVTALAIVHGTAGSTWHFGSGAGCGNHFMHEAF